MFFTSLLDIFKEERYILLGESNDLLKLDSPIILSLLFLRVKLISYFEVIIAFELG